MTDDKFTQGKSVDVLNTRGLATKREYVRDLRLRGDPQALSLLVECLCDESWYTRDLAERAFLTLDPPRGDLLLPLLDQGLWYTRTTVARILGRLAYRPAVPALLVLVDDANAPVGDAAREALVAIGTHDGSLRIAHALHRAAPDLRQRRLREIGEADHALRERLERMMRSEELMAVRDPDAEGDDSPVVRTVEDGVEWELLTGPSSPAPKAAKPPSRPEHDPGAGGAPPERPDASEGADRRDG